MPKLILACAFPILTLFSIYSWVGILDEDRLQLLMKNVLEKIRDIGSKVLIIDINGVLEMDVKTAKGLVKVINSSKLMGCAVVVSGVSPKVAQNIATSDIAKSFIATNTLKGSLIRAFNMINLNITFDKIVRN